MPRTETILQVLVASPEDVSEGYDIFQHQLKEQAKIPFLKSPVKYCSFRISRGLAKIFFPNIPDIIIRTLQSSEYLIAEQSAQQADVVIHPDLVGFNWFELNRVDDLVKVGENAVRERLPEIKKLIEE